MSYFKVILLISLWSTDNEHKTSIATLFSVIFILLNDRAISQVLYNKRNGGITFHLKRQVKAKRKQVCCHSYHCFSIKKAL